MRWPLLRLGSRRRVRTAPLVFSLSVLAGCGGESHEERVARCARLEGAKASGLPALVDEVARIEAAGETPLALASASLPAEDNGAAVLAESLSDQARLRLYPKFADLMPGERFEFGLAELNRVRETVRGSALWRERLLEAEAAPAFEFDAGHDQGFFGGMRFLDDAAIACRLHLLGAAPRIADGDLAGAFDELDAALRWVDRLARSRRLEARLRAAHLRAECLTVVEAIARGDGSRPGELVATGFQPQAADYERLYTLLSRSLAGWTDARGALVGDRAVTMHCYEAVRLGLFDRLVTYEERSLLERRGVLDAIEQITPEQIDRDQLTYLETIAKLIAGSSRPYHEVAEEFEATLRRLDPTGVAGPTAEAEAAPLAANLFLVGLGHAIREIGRDRAICEAWAIAIAAAGELDLPPYATNPVTGADYEIDRLAGQLIVRVGDPELRDPVARIRP